MTAPARSVDQRHQALQVENRVRRQRADFKQQLRHGDMLTGAANVSQLLAFPPFWARTWQVFDLLDAIPMVGPARVARITTRLGISSRKTVEGLSGRQRVELCEWLDGVASSRRAA